jgi:hypothetical protein
MRIPCRFILETLTEAKIIQRHAWEAGRTRYGSDPVTQSHTKIQGLLYSPFLNSRNLCRNGTSGRGALRLWRIMDGKSGACVVGRVFIKSAADQVVIDEHRSRALYKRAIIIQAAWRSYK